jgi:hypothetical protein
MRSQTQSTNGKFWIFALVVAIGFAAYLIDQSKRKRARFRTDTKASVFELTTDSISRPVSRLDSQVTPEPLVTLGTEQPVSTPNPLGSNVASSASARSPVCKAAFEPLKALLLEQPDRYLKAAQALKSFEQTPECLKLNGSWSFSRTWDEELRTTCIARNLDAVHLLRCDAILAQLISLARLSETPGNGDLRTLNEKQLMALGRLGVSDRRWSEGRTRELQTELRNVSDELLRRDPNSHLAREYAIAAELASLRDGDALAVDRLKATFDKFNNLDDPMMDDFGAPSSSLERAARYEAATHNSPPIERIDRMRDITYANPEDPVARIYLAQALMRDGRVEDAKNELREAAHLAPFDPFVQENVRILNAGDRSTEVDLGMVFDQ